MRVIGLLNANELFGQEKANIEVLDALRSRGAEVIVGVNSKESGGDVGIDLRRRGIQTFDVPFGFQWSKQFFAKKPSLIVNNMRYLVRSTATLRKAIARFTPSHIHITNPLTFSFIFPALSHRSLSVVYRMGDEPPRSSNPNMWIWRRCVQRANLLVANSEFVRKSILRDAPGVSAKLSLIYNTTAEALSLSKEFIRSSTPRFLFVGQISEHKGIHHFVEAAIQIGKEHMEAHFDILGGSIHTTRLETDLRNRIIESGMSNRIHMHGHQQELSKFYSQAWALVVPSLFEEPAANVVLEAKSYGLPSIVYPSGGLPELLMDEISGWICREKAVPMLLEAFRRVISEGNRLDRFSKNCIDEYHTRFGRENFGRQWYSAYASLKKNLPC